MPVYLNIYNYYLQLQKEKMSLLLLQQVTNILLCLYLL